MTAHGMLIRMHLRLTGWHPLLSRDLQQAPTRDGDLVIDARRLVFAGPLELAGTVALAHAARVRGQKTTLLTPTDPNVTGYLQRTTRRTGEE